VAVFRFETIAPDEAMTLTVDDTVWFETGSALRTSVLFLEASGAYAVTIDDRTVLFGPALADVAAEGGLKYPDLSRLLVGGPGNDALLAEAGSPIAILGGGGNDMLRAMSPFATARGDDGDDTITGVEGATMFGGLGADVLSVVDDGSGHGGFLHGNLGDDQISGSHADEILLGGQGSDLVVGSGGNDILIGNRGDDTVQGTGHLMGESGSDMLISQTTEAGRGDDLDGGEDADTLQGAAGTDTLAGGTGDDWVSDSGGLENRLDGGSGNDVLEVTGGSATLMGGEGEDTLSGGDADEVMADGGAGQDVLYGSTGADTLVAGDGGDTLEGGAGGDRLYGGGGADVFVMPNAAIRDGIAITDISLTPQILDWSADDRIRFPEALQSPAALATATALDIASAVDRAEQLGADPDVDLVAVQVAGDVILFWQGAAPSAVLVGNSLADISADSFI